MKIKSIAQSIIFSFIACGAVFNPNLLSNAQNRGQGVFYCGTDNGKPATIVRHPSRGELSFIIWDTNYFGNQYTPQRRCEIVSDRLESNQRNETLTTIVEGRLNNYPVLCASPDKEVPNSVINCSDERLILTLRPTDDPQEAINILYGLNTGISPNPYHSSRPSLAKSPDGTKVGIVMDGLIHYSNSICNNLFGPCE